MAITFNPEKAYSEIPQMLLRELDLNDLPLARKQKFIEFVQAQLDEALQIVLLESLSDDSVLVELENVFLADEEIDEESLLFEIARAIPDFAEKWEAACQKTYQILSNQSVN